MAKRYKVREMIVELQRLGCVPERTAQSTSHKMWRTPKGNTIALSVKHLNDSIAIGTLKQIVRRLAEEGLVVK